MHVNTVVNVSLPAIFDYSNMNETVQIALAQGEFTLFTKIDQNILTFSPTDSFIGQYKVTVALSYKDIEKALISAYTFKLTVKSSHLSV